MATSAICCRDWARSFRSSPVLRTEGQPLPGERRGIAQGRRRRHTAWNRSALDVVARTDGQGLDRSAEHRPAALRARRRSVSHVESSLSDSRRSARRLRADAPPPAAAPAPPPAGRSCPADHRSVQPVLNHPERYGVSNIRPSAAYRAILPGRRRYQVASASTATTRATRGRIPASCERSPIRWTGGGNGGSRTRPRRRSPSSP